MTKHNEGLGVVGRGGGRLVGGLLGVDGGSLVGDVGDVPLGSGAVGDDLHAAVGEVDPVLALGVVALPVLLLAEHRAGVLGVVHAELILKMDLIFQCLFLSNLTIVHKTMANELNAETITDGTRGDDITISCDLNVPPLISRQ